MPDNICIFGGTFDPIHRAHIMLADYVVSANMADRVVLMPSPLNPLKAPDAAPFADRLEMCRLAADGHRHIEVSAFESTLHEPHYTADTLTAFAKAHPGARLSLLIGSDNLRIFHLWHAPDEILRLARLLVYPRPGDPTPEVIPDGVTLLSPPDISDISATEIRRLAALGRDITPFVAPDVAAYIARRSLYSHPTH